MILCVALMIVCACLTGSARGQTAAAAQDELVTAPVELDGDVLFHVRGTTSFPAEKRADLITQRLLAVASDPMIRIDSFHIVPGDGAIRIAAGDLPLMHLVEADASLEQIGPRDLATAHSLRMQQAIVQYREARSWAALRHSTVNSLGASLVVALATAVIVWVWRSADRFLARRLRARIHSVGIQSFELMRAERIWAVTRSTVLALRTVVLMAISLMYVGYVLAQFPWTRRLSRNMVAFALWPLEVMASAIVFHIPSLIFLAVLFFVVRLALRMTRVFFDALARGTVKLTSFDADWAQPTYKIVRIAVVAFGLIVAYPYIPGSDSAAFKGISLFVGVLFSLGSSTAIANIVAGYMMTYRRAFKIGDRVKVGATVGDVTETRLQVTHLRSPKNEELIIPNSQLLANEVLNYSSLARTDGLILHTQVGIGYETPWRQVEAMLLMAAERTAGLTMDPPPFVLEKELADFAVTYELNVYCRNVAMMNGLYSALHRNILDVFNEYGVQIMTPAYEADPAEPKLVARKDWCLPPARSGAGAEGADIASHQKRRPIPM